MLTAVAGLLLLAAPGAQAAGFGRPPSSVPLGSPLNFALPLVLDADESIDADCLGAEVQVGERRLAAYNLRVALEAGGDGRERLLRVQTLVPIEEPVVTVQLSVGCTTRVVRRFTVFADPPLGMAALPPAATEPVAATRAAGAESATLAAAPSSAASAKAVSASAPKRAARARQAAAAKRSPLAKAAPADGAKPAGRAKLRLEAAEPTSATTATAAAAAPASAVAVALQAAQAAEAAASASAARVRELEQQLTTLLAEGRAQREQLQQLHARLAAGDGGARGLSWALAALAVAVLGLVALALRLRRVQREGQQRWWTQAASEVLATARPDPPAPTPAVAAPTPVTAGPGAGLAPPVRPPEPAPLADEVEVVDVPPVVEHAAAGAPVEPSWTTATPPRPVSVEELIDLEQQAEFFVVLGQDDAAIDLLVGHLRDSGGTSPLPYLKLLEIYRQRGDRDNYERTRSRFNQRFNAYAPDWDVDIEQGRPLEAYPQVMQRLQQVWRRPLDAMAELESLLFRKRGGELFELPAYRELLLLYSLARDLLDPQDAPGEPVDLLLPLDDDRLTATAARPRLDDTRVLQPGAALGPADGLPRLELDLDLDLSEPPLPRDFTRPAVLTDLQLDAEPTAPGAWLPDHRPPGRGQG